MQEERLDRLFCDMKISITLAEGQTVAEVVVLDPCGVRVRHALDIERFLSAGVAPVVALEQSLDAVCVGISAIVLQHA